MGGSTGDSVLRSGAGNREDSILGVLPAEVAGLESGTFGTIGPDELDGLENDRKSGGGSKIGLDITMLFLLFLLDTDTLSLSSLALALTLLALASDAIASLAVNDRKSGGGSKIGLDITMLFLLFLLDTEMLSLSSFAFVFLLPASAPASSSATSCVGLPSGSFRLATLGMGGSTGGARLTPLILNPLPSLVCGLRLSGLGLPANDEFVGTGGMSKSKFICKGLTSGAVVEVVVVELDTVR